jgi:hypothetical protein
MLWYKAWLETRSRFQVSLLGFVALCCFQVFYDGTYLSGERLRPYNPWIFITGLGYLHWRPSLTIDPIPWLHMAVTLLIALSLVAISIKAIQRREF